MRKIGIIAVLSLMALAIAAVPVLAATNFNNAPSGAHYKNGSVEPVCTPDFDAVSVECSGTQIGGVGNMNAVLELTLSADADVVCRNPGSKKQIVEPHSYTDTESITVPLAPSRNGTLIVPGVDASITPSEVDADFQCPNPNWTDEVTNVTLSGFTYTLTFVGFANPVISLP